MGSKGAWRVRRAALVRRLRDERHRQAPRLAPFSPSDPRSGYYVDYTTTSTEPWALEYARDTVAALTEDRSRANPVTISQAGLRAWQMLQGTGDRTWQEIVERTCSWLAGAMEPDGRLLYHTAVRNTFAVKAPWCSAMAQGQAASLLVRGAHSLGDDRLVEAAARAVSAMLAPDQPMADRRGRGLVLQEYPTDPPSDVLNGWIYAAWGLHDVALTTGDRAITLAFRDTVRTLAQRLPGYDVTPRWSAYDRYPRLVRNVASPYYHGLHVVQLSALHQLAPHAVFSDRVARWSRGAERRLPNGVAITRKVAFRLLYPWPGLTGGTGSSKTQRVPV